MFRPPPHHRQGGPPRNNGLYLQQSLGMNAGTAFVSQGFPMHGRGRGLHPPFHGEHLNMFPPSRPPSLARPPPPPGSPPLEIPPPPPPSDTNFRSTPKQAPPPPPPMPKNPEMLKNIDILSSFVVKNGPQFENMARAKQAGDPKFAFLFGGERGSDAAFGFEFYNWKKEHLRWVEEKTRASPVDQQRPSEHEKNGVSVVAGISQDSPDSLGGSDMDMEDDFALPHPISEKDSDLRIPAFGRKPGPSSTLSERGGDLLPATVRVESKGDGELHRDSTQQSGNRLAAEMLGKEDGGGTARATDIVRVPREVTSLDIPKRRGSRRRTGFDRPCMEDVSPKGSPGRTQQQMDSPTAFDPYQKGASGNGRREILTKASRWGPEPSECRGSGFAASDKIPETNKGGKKLDSSAQKRGESSLSKDRCHSPDVEAKVGRSLDDGNVNVKLKLKSGSDQPAVDEFGRLLRQGGSDSDPDDNRYGERRKRRRTSSRSRSRSREDDRFKYQSPNESPHGWGRRSRSWSSSPRRNRSRSLTPLHDKRWGGEGRDDRGPLDKGGRRGGRGIGGTTPICYDFLKGKCSRGSSCRYLHGDSQGGKSDHGDKWVGRRGQDREQGQADRPAEEGDRSWGGRVDTKRRRHCASDEPRVGEPAESKLTPEQEKAEHGVDEPLKQFTGTSDDSVKAAEEAGRAGNNYQQVALSSETMTSAFAASSIALPAPQRQSSIPPEPVSQACPQINVLARPLLPQQPSIVASNSVSETQKLSSLVSQFGMSPQPSYGVSPTPHAQPLQFPSALTHLQQNALLTLTSSQLHKPSLQPLPTLAHINSVSSDAMHQQFTPGRNLSSGSSPPFQVLAPPFSSVQLGRPHVPFGGSQQPNFAQFVNSNGQGSAQSIPQMRSVQPQRLPSPTIQTLQSKPGLAWISGPPPTSYAQAPPQSLQQPLRPPPHSLPPQVSSAPAGVYSYSLPSNYVMPSYSTLPSNDVPARQRPSTQYDPLSDSLEPAPPGSVDKKDVLSNNGNSSQEIPVKLSEENWRHNSVGMMAPLMTNAGEVVLENVSPGLPGHVETVARGSAVMGRISPVPQPEMIMENVSPTDVSNSFKSKTSMRLGAPEPVSMDNGSPEDEKPTEVGESGKGSAPKTVGEKKSDKEARVLNLIRKAVAEQVKDLLKPTWKGGQITKDAFKTIAKKAVDKVMGALEGKGQIPKTQEKVDSFMKSSKPKIAKLVQGYVDKYVRA